MIGLQTAMEVAEGIRKNLLYYLMNLPKEMTTVDAFKLETIINFVGIDVIEIETISDFYLQIIKAAADSNSATVIKALYDKLIYIQQRTTNEEYRMCILKVLESL